MIETSSGHAAIDGYLAARYEHVPGMSSRFAAAICGHVIRRQTERGIEGDVVEIGTFTGRFFIAMALGLASGEQALGIDRFDWPDQTVHAELLRHCAAAGLPRESFATWKTDSRTVTAAELRAKLGGRSARFVHIDGEHTAECLRSDLELAHAVLHPNGVIALDDMLHPSYPMLVATVFEYLSRHPDMRVVCIIDRTSISAATKFLLCRVDAAAHYERDLMTAFARFHFVVGSQVAGHLTLVLTPDPTLPEL
jgi:predicted O-methyltransferase YrrM